MTPGSDIEATPDNLSTTGELRQLGTGMTLGRYTLLRRIAAGGMAEVYAARSQGISGFEKTVAIKKILPQFSLNKRFVDMLVDEAKITVVLTHPNIAQIYELGLEGDTYYIVMEHVDGRPLNRLMQKLDVEDSATVPIEHAVHITTEVAKGLHHAHQTKDNQGRPLGIVHRDVSPQNVLLAYTGDVKLIDFGIARAAGRAAKTRAGTIKGKLRYLAPEIAMGEEPDHRADVFCCGIILFEMLTGEALFAPRTDIEAIELATEARVRSPRLANPRVSEDLEDIVMKALRRNREERYQGAKALYSDLRRFLNHHYPAYVGSELGDLMQARFQQEIAEDRRLDALADEIVERMKADVDNPTLGVEQGELAGLIDSASTKPGRYRQLVTRTGEASGEHPEPTLRAMRADQEDTGPDESQVDRAAEPTVAGVPPTRAASDQTQPALVGSADTHKETAQFPREVSEVAAPHAPSTRRFALAALAVVLVGLWLGYHLMAPDDAVPPPLVREGTLVVRVTPEVPVTVRIDGAAVAEGVQGRVRVPGLSSGHSLRVEVSAEGFVPAEKTVDIEPGGALEIDFQLTHRRGEIRLLGPVAHINVSTGAVNGSRVTGVRYGTEVALEVDRGRGPKWSAKVRVDRPVIELEVPAPPRPIEPPPERPSKPGVLFVNSRPYSKVYVNDRAKGRTPRRLSLKPGRYKITLKRGGKAWVKRVRVGSGKTTTVTHRWPR